MGLSSSVVCERMNDLFVSKQFPKLQQDRTIVNISIEPFSRVWNLFMFRLRRDPPPGFSERLISDGSVFKNRVSGSENNFKFYERKPWLIKNSRFSR